MGHVSAVVGVDLGPLGIGPTPIAILVTVLVVGLVITALLVLASQLAGGFVDKRWPANEPLTPSEVLWAESGGHVHRSFPGLDPVIARDLTQYITSKKVTPGTVIIDAGDLASQFVFLKSGAAEVAGPAGIQQVKAGASFGGDNILRRMPHNATVRITAPSEIMSVGAEDYLAAVALGMSDDDDDYVVHVLGGYFNVPDAAPTPTAPAAVAPTHAAPSPVPSAAPSTAPPPPPASVAHPPPPPTSPPPPSAAAVRAARAWASATHRVVRAELDGFVLPGGDSPTRTLVAGTEVQQFETVPGWAHVRTVDGWQGWVSGAGLGPA